MTDLYRDKSTGWMADAACRDLPGWMFFADKEDAPNPYAAGQVVCRRCPAQDACREFALSDPPELFGLFGGMTPRERIAERTRRDRARRSVRSA